MRRLTPDVAPCGIRHIHLEALPAGVSLEPGERAVLVVVWRSGQPLGSRVLLASELPLPAGALPALAADIAADGILGLDQQATPTITSRQPARVTVVICTRERPADLRRCLASVSRCEPPPAEIVVVDNAPDGNATAAVVAEYPTARYVRESVPGLSHARNRGLASASGSLIAFTDDDVEVPTNWIAASAEPFADPEVACVTGTVLPADLSNDAACLFEFETGGLGKSFVSRRYRRDDLDRGLLRAPEVWTIGAGANMVVRRSAFAAVGGFDPRLGAGTSGCSEDSEFWFRLLRAGLVCVYEPASVVFHRHRPDWQALSRQLRAYARGHVTALFIQWAQDHHPSHLVRVAGVLPWHYTKLAGRALFRGNTLELKAIGYQALGCLEGIVQAPYWLTRSGYRIRQRLRESDMSSDPAYKAPLGPFLARNPFDGPFTDGLYFRDKMRAIHAVAPDTRVERLLEVGGGRSGLSAMLYPRARVVNIDMDPAVATAPSNRGGSTLFVTGSATELPFPAGTFDIVTMFDLLEHVVDDGRAAREALRVLRPGGCVLVTTPDRVRWKYPYYRVFTPICPAEEQLFAEWGHVRRGYTQAELDGIFERRAETTAAFVNPWLAVSHDIAFSRLPKLGRTLLHAAVAPISLVGWFRYGPDSPGTEIAARWRKSPT